MLYLSLHFSIPDKPNTLYQYHNMYRQCACMPVILYYFTVLYCLLIQSKNMVYNMEYNKFILYNNVYNGTAYKCKCTCSV